MGWAMLMPSWRASRCFRKSSISRCGAASTRETRRQQEWAQFAVRRGVEIHPDIYQPLGRFEKNSSAKRLIDAGVPLAYAKELDIVHWGEEYPVEGVIESWLANLAPEYARTILFKEAA